MSSTSYSVSVRRIAELPWTERARSVLEPLITEATERVAIEADTTAQRQAEVDAYKEELKEAHRLEAMGHSPRFPEPPQQRHLSDLWWRWWEAFENKAGDLIFEHAEHVYADAVAPIRAVIDERNARARQAINGDALDEIGPPDWETLASCLFVIEYLAQLRPPGKFGHTQFDVGGQLQVPAASIDWLSDAIAGRWAPPRLQPVPDTTPKPSPLSEAERVDIQRQVSPRFREASGDPNAAMGFPPRDL